MSRLALGDLSSPPAGADLCGEVLGARYRKCEEDEQVGPGDVIGAAYAFALAPDGRVAWCGKGVGLLDENTNEVFLANFNSPDPYRSLAVGPDGSLWVGASIIQQLRTDGTRSNLDIESFPSWVSTFISHSPALGIWGRSESGYFRIDSHDRAVRLDANDLVGSKRIHQSLQSGEGHELIATDAGVFKVEINGNRLTMRPEPAELLGTRAIALLRDREGNLWVGLDGGGLAQCAPRKFVEVTSSQLEFPANHSQFASDDHGGLWLGHESSEFLWRWIPGQGFQPWDSSAAPRLAGLKMLLRAQDGTLWIRTHGALLACRNEKVVRYDYPPLGPVVHRGCLHEDRQGRIWCGSDQKLHCLDGTEFKSWSTRDVFSPGNIPIAFADESGGGLWMTDGNQLCRLFEGQFTPLSDFDGAALGSARTLFVADSNLLMVGCYGGGLVCIRDQNITRVTTEHGLHDNYISRILTDETGHLWISSNQGAFRILTDELSELAAGRTRRLTSRALFSTEANGAVGCRMANGKLAFRTVKGLVLIDPSRLVMTVASPRVTRFEVEVGGRRVDFEKEVVARGSRDLTFHYAAPTFIDPGNARYEWRMVNLLNDWKKAGKDRTVHLPSLPPGDYRFEVRAAVGNGMPGPVTGVDLQLPPKLHESWWFRAAVVMVGITLLAGAFQLRHHAALRREKTLNLEIQRRTTLEQSLHKLSRELLTVQERERHRIAKDLHDDLNQRLALLAIDVELLCRRGDITQNKEVVATLQAFASGVQDVSEATRRIAHELYPASLEHLGLEKALENLCENVCARGIQVDFIAHGAKRLPPDLELGVYRVTQEALQNIVNHSKSRTAAIEVDFGVNDLCVAINDDGKGFDAESAQPGLGLLSMQERVALLGGTFSVTSRPGEGTRVNVQVPLPQEDPQSG